MADEDTALVADGIDVPGDAEIASPRTVEDYARERGWVPQEEWTGEGDWRDAESFVSFGLDKGRDTAKELKSLRSTVESISATTARIAQEAANKARQEERDRLQGLHAKAVDDGDHVAANQAVDQLAGLKAQELAQAGKDPRVAAFEVENPWVNTDPIAAAVAIAAAGEVGKRLGAGSVEEQIAAAKDAVFKRFPEYAPKAPEKVIEVSSPAGRSAPATNRAKGFHDMPREAQDVARELVKRGMFKKVEDYVHHYFDKEGTVG